MQSAIKNMAAIAANMRNLIAAWSGLATFAIQAQPIQHHHNSMTIKVPRSSPFQVRSSAMKAVTWVSAKTKTRSKNSSIG